ncbi:hypothetical protein BX666DRAFT_406998 [Dichotomocladium elegans]|nr:hypothetical protein BX666DRAFT_406998 [Dichotomocladium elegans]
MPFFSCSALYFPFPKPPGARRNKEAESLPLRVLFLSLCIREMRLHKRLIALAVLAVGALCTFKLYHDSIIEGIIARHLCAPERVSILIDHLDWVSSSAHTHTHIAIQSIAISMRSNPFSPLLLGLMIIVTSTPPMLGFTFLVTLSGFVYGFPGGVLPAMISAWIGAILCFYLIRRYNIERFIQMSPSKQEKYNAIQEAIQEGGFGMLLMIRLTPIPWPFTNMILSLIPSLTFERYALVSFLGAFKCCLEVWFGSQLASLSDPNLPPSAHRLTMITLGGGGLILVGLAVWLHRMVMRKAKPRHQQHRSVSEKGLFPPSPCHAD